MKQLVKEKDVKVSQILKDHWTEFKKTKLYKVPEDMRKSIVKAAEKALNSGDISKGYTKYICIECDNDHEVIVGHSCKSRFYNRYGKVHVKN